MHRPWQAALLLVVSLVLSLVPSLVPSHALAQGDDEARRHFRLAEAHYANGSFEEAAREFEEAYRLSQRPQLLYNLYLAYRDAADLEHAAEALRRYLELVPDAEGEEMLRGRLAALERTLAERRPADARPADTAATSSGSGDATATQGTADASASEAGSGGGETGDAAAVATTTTTRTETSTEPASGGGASPVPWIVGGAGVAILVAGAITGGMALGSQGELDSTCPNRACPPGYDYESTASTGRTLAITTDVLLATGVVALGTGIVLLAVMGTGGEEAPPATAGVACDGTGCAVAVRARF